MIVSSPDNIGGFYAVTPDNVGFSYDLDLDYRTSGSFTDIFGYEAFYDEYFRFTRAEQNSETTVNHGDWVVEAICQTLDNPSNTQLLCIDVDTLNGWDSHLDNLFDLTSYTFQGATYTGSSLEAILGQYLDYNDARFNQSASDSFVPVAMSISIAGAPPSPEELAAFILFETIGSPIIQAAPNVNQGYFDWGSVYSDVINVGAWNQGSNGGLLLSSLETIPTLDILADGFVEKAGWGANFGTSFATPKVAASLANYVNDFIEGLNASGSSIADNNDNSNYDSSEYAELVDWIVETLSTKVSAQFENFSYDFPIPVLSDSIEENGYLPLTVSGLTGLSDYKVQTASLYEVGNTANRQPSLVTASTVNTNEDTASSSIAFSATDPDGDALHYTFSDPFKGSVTNNANGTYTYTPAANVNGSDSFTVTVTDGTVDVSQTVDVTINAVNDAPVLTTSATLSTDEDTASSAIAFSGADVDGDNLTYSFNTPSKGSVANNGDGTYTYTPAANVNGSDSFAVTVTDGTVDVSQTVDVTINAVNDAPTLDVVTNSVYENDGSGARIASLSSADVDGDSIIYSIKNEYDAWAVEISENRIFFVNSYYHDHEGDPLKLTVVASDGIDNTEKTFEFSTLNVDEGPNWSEEARTNNIINYLISEDEASQKLIGTFTASDPEGDPFQYNIEGHFTSNNYIDANASFLDGSTTEISSAGIYGTLNTNINTGEFSYLLNGNAQGVAAGETVTDKFNVGITLGGNIPVAFTIAGSNDAPVLTTSATLSTDEDTAITAIAFSATDVDGDNLSYAFSTPSKGSVANNGDGTYTYTPAANVNGSDSFTVTVTDGTVDVSQTVDVTINANDNTITGTSGDVVGGLNIEQLSKAGDVVTYGLIADASYDINSVGIEALDFAINFDPSDLVYIDGSLTSDYNWSMDLTNETEASSGSVRGGFTKFGGTFTDFSNPIAEFQMTVLETSEPVALSITGTSIDGGAAPDTIETFSYMSSTLTATVITRDGKAMDGVAVSTSDNSQTTDSSGQLTFEVSNGSDVVMDASLAFENTSATRAINSMDALQALRIAVGLDTSNGPATYEDYIAADIDGSGSVNSMDALNILKYAVGLDAPDPHWVFIDSAADHSAIKQTSVNYDTGMTLEDFSADASVSLTGILVGDIDDSYSGLIA